MKWSYGVTTTPERLGDLLPRTLHSLAMAGFGEPRLFVDGSGTYSEVDYAHFDLPITLRSEKVYAYPHWILSAWELYFRDPFADRYAIFQDDLLAVHNLRTYLEQCEYPERGYLNLFSFLGNDDRFKKEPTGWYEALTLNGKPGGPQGGKGAVGLVFSRPALIALLDSGYLAVRFHDYRHRDRGPMKGGMPRGYTHLDGAIVTAMNFHPGGPWREYIHNPSLLQHTGFKSTIGSCRLPQSSNFPGESFDALDLL